ncbi:hypothetical protein Ahy_B04g068963 [Arachis hypogaea]|uniref:Uncharacterized protein n=1 Tax=Arachis hypogaea TaxID=3818 RepID=A0A444ZB84_ARAHY|nr:hypothetical protein Ahy_B04g068963 [Arachis hypogaea]
MSSFILFMLCFTFLVLEDLLSQLLNDSKKVALQWFLLPLINVPRVTSLSLNPMASTVKLHDIDAIGFYLNEVTLGTLIKGICEEDRIEEAIEVLQIPEKKPTKPNLIIYDTVVDA